MMQQRTSIPTPPQRPEDGHKGSFGTVVVLGGSPTMIGAPALCARSAFRSGAGLVKIHASPDLLPHILTLMPSATGLAADKVSATFLAVEPRAVLAAGPGWGVSETTGAVLDQVLGLPNRMVLDADGLNLLADRLGPKSGRLREADLILTPHPGEYRRLARPLGIKLDPTHPDQRIEAAGQLAQRLGAVVVLKGYQSVIADGRNYAVNRTGNPALATAGSGDVLTGLVAGLIAQGISVFDSAVLGAHVHGLAADRWAGDRGRPAGMLASELADLIPEAMAGVA
ncbi:MAG: NAD(P)H-hydrate dehydratase [Planctomycetota bacterium]